MFFGMVAADLVDTRKVTTPMLVMGGTGDEVYSARDVRRTAHAYQTLPAAVTIESWLGQHGL
ncbi:hypothetical protein GAN17_05170 [Mycobacterium kubicae]|uniref:hypothetical protein n=1 Tax=Mycobacterium kubicae TaxID=120959 RepID=UPI00163EA8A8|nr:hypothetical protein [Mycobacterium kubicae]QNI05748.1 hypothetical protein GAN17_05170 [Mycobacterium kubicae]